MISHVPRPATYNDIKEPALFLKRTTMGIALHKLGVKIGRRPRTPPKGTLDGLEEIPPIISQPTALKATA